MILWIGTWIKNVLKYINVRIKKIKIERYDLKLFKIIREIIASIIISGITNFEIFET